MTLATRTPFDAGSVVVTHEPTSEQESIVNRPPIARLLVTAGPGTGKTETLVWRVAGLVTNAGLSPVDDLLVLSFTRAAVSEIRSRVVAASGGTAYVSPLTFDSFATRLLAAADPGGAWSEPSVDYDGRISAAAGLLVSSPDAQEHVRGFRHIAVDETQDLVGVRADFLMRLLAVACSGETGFTLFGDPAQAIYDFLEEGGGSTTTAGAFDRWVRASFSPELEQYELTINHRAQTDRLRDVAIAGLELSRRDPDLSEVTSLLRETTDSLPQVDLGGCRAHSTNRQHGTTAVLCRTNGNALLISSRLHEGSVAHRLRGSALARHVPSWVARLLAFARTSRLSRAAVEQYAALANVEAAASNGDAWSDLKRLEGGEGTVLDLDRLHESVRIGRVPDDLVAGQRSGNAYLEVSTVHRAKGLEYDHVFLMEWEAIAEDGVMSPPEELRVLYVALTRARSDLQLLEPQTMFGLRRHDTERWFVRWKGWKTPACEISSGDLAKTSPPGYDPAIGIGARATQEYLGSAVHRGDEIELRRIWCSESNLPGVRYGVYHDDTLVAETSDQFSREFYQVLRVRSGWKIRWPMIISDLHIDDVVTVAGSKAAGRNAGLNRWGLWMAPVFRGLGRLKF